jgi:hypothetical protein
MPMFTTHENVAAARRIAEKIIEVVDAAGELPTGVAANAVLSAFVWVIIENAARRGADPYDDAAQWATNLCSAVKLQLEHSS